MEPAPPVAPGAPRAPRGDFGDAAWFALSVGHEGRAEARWLLPKICEAGAITKEAIGAIRVRQDQTFVQIAAAEAHRFGEGIELEPGLSMRRLAGEPAWDHPEGTARRSPPARARKPLPAAREGVPVPTRRAWDDPAPEGGKPARKGAEKPAGKAGGKPAKASAKPRHASGADRPGKPPRR